MGNTGVEQYPFRGRGFTRVDVRRYTNITIAL